jgi:uncharacterized membrane protein YkoI
MKRSTKVTSGIAIGVAAVAAASLTVANATGGEDEPDDDGSETAISGDALERASEVALDHTGGGRVTGSEVGDEESYYEIEVTLDNGDQVDVQIDESFNVVGDENDGSSDDD